MPVDSDNAAIVARCRRIGWDVELPDSDGGATKWAYRITRPDGVKVQLHRTPSRTNWRAAKMRELNGREKLFDKAEADFAEADERRRLAKLDADRARNDVKLAEAARKAKASEKQAAAVRMAAGGGQAPEPFDAAWLLTPHAFPETRIGILTPELAAKLKDLNVENYRNLRNARKAYFVDVITNGEWSCTHQGMAVDTRGYIQDGQHRGAAVEETGVAVEIQITVGVPEGNVTKIDIPLQRYARDAAARRGEKNPLILSAAARTIVLFDRYGNDLHLRWRGARVTIDTVDKASQRMGDDLRDAVGQAVLIQRGELKSPGSAMAAGIYLIGRAVGRDDPRVIEFFEKIESGEAKRSEAEAMFRKYAIRTLTDGGRRDQIVYLAHVLKAWNIKASRRDQPDSPNRLSSLTWKPSEWFPGTIIVPAPLPVRRGRK